MVAGTLRIDAVPLTPAASSPYIATSNVFAGYSRRLQLDTASDEMYWLVSHRYFGFSSPLDTHLILPEYPTKTIDEVSLGKGEYGAQSASIEYDPTRPRYVRITDINDDGTLNDDVVASINPDDDEQYRLEYGDFLFARMGATVGKTFAFIAGNQIFAGYLIRYKLNQKLINPRYFFGTQSWMNTGIG